MDHNALRRYRHQKGLSQAQLAHAVGVAPVRIAMLESGEGGSVSLMLERRIAQTLGVRRDLIAADDLRVPDRRAHDNGVAQPRRRGPRRNRGANA